MFTLYYGFKWIFFSIDICFLFCHFSFFSFFSLCLCFLFLSIYFLSPNCTNFITLIIFVFVAIQLFTVYQFLFFRRNIDQNWMNKQIHDVQLEYDANLTANKQLITITPQLQSNFIFNLFRYCFVYVCVAFRLSAYAFLC